ncbi:MAG: SGNH/GDSL hydrolase family protein [Myxococcota bacterium]
MASPRRRHRLRRFVLASGALFWACAGRETEPSAPPAVSANAREDLAKLSRLRVFFGHQSVGENIVHGLQSAAESAGVSELVVLPWSGTATAPGFYHAPIGQNRDPASKLRAFEAVLDSPGAASLDVALMKLCYVDIDRTVDPDRVLSDYLDTVRRIRAKHPRLRLVHVTTPLMVPEGYSKLKTTVKSLFGVENDNLRRNRYNRRLQEALAGEPIFDLAAAEAQRQDGSRVEDDGMLGLAAEYTTDGGHLNALGQRKLALALARALGSP